MRRTTVPAMTLLDINLAFHVWCKTDHTENALAPATSADHCSKTLDAVLTLTQELDREIRRHEMRLRMLSAKLAQAGHPRNVRT